MTEWDPISKNKKQKEQRKANEGIEGRGKTGERRPGGWFLWLSRQEKIVETMVVKRSGGVGRYLGARTNQTADGQEVRERR